IDTDVNWQASFRQREDASIFYRQLLRIRSAVDLSRTLFRRAAEFCSRRWVACAVIAAIGFLVHVPALSGNLIWDDTYLARDNPFIKSPLLAVESFRHYLFLDSFSGHYR